MGRSFTILAITLAMLCIAVTYAFGLYLFASIEPSIRDQIGFDQATTGMLTAGSMAGFLLFSFLSGWLRNLLGANLMTTATLAVCALCLAWQAFAQDVWTLAVQRFLLGACTATIWAPMVEIIPRFVATRYQGRALGLISSGTNYGLVLNGLLTFIVLKFGDWRDLFLVTAALSLLVGITWLPTVARTSIRGSRHLIPRQEDAVPPIGHIPEAVRPVMIIAAIGGWVGMPATSFLAAFSTDDLDLPASYAALSWMLMGAIGMVSGATLGALSDWLGYRSAFSLALFLLVLASGAFVVGIPAFVTPVIIASPLAIGFFPIYGLIPSFIAKSTTPENTTGIFGYVNVALGIAGMLGNAAAGFARTATGGHATFLLSPRSLPWQAF